MSSAADQAVTKAERERDSAKRTIQYLEKRLIAHAAKPLNAINVDKLLKTLSLNEEKVIETFDRIIANCDPTKVDPHQAEYEDLMDKVIDLASEFQTIKAAFPVATANPGHSAAAPPTVSFQLPKLTLPTFDGKIEEWISFRDMFIAAIHSSTKLTDSQKLTYLKGQLKGEAARLIQSLAISDANFPIAWKQLEDRYQNDRQLLFALLSRLVNQPVITSSSSLSLRSLVDTTTESMRSLESIAQPVKEWDAILLYLTYQKLDPHSKELYEHGLANCTVPKLQSLVNFIEQRSRALEAGGNSKSSVNNKPIQQNIHRRNQVHLANNSQPSNQCKVCESSSHPLYRCSKFIGMSVQERVSVVRTNGNCYNYLRAGHSLSQCNSTSVCKHCNGKHNSLIHSNRNNTPAAAAAAANPPTPAVVSNANPSLTHHSNVLNSVSQTLLATANVYIYDVQGNLQPVRVLLDGGSDTHVISSKCIKRLGLSYIKKQALVTGLSSTPVGTTMGIMDLQIYSQMDTFTPIQAKSTCVMTTVTAHLPLHPCNPNLPLINGLQLADNNWHTPGEIDMLIGASLFYDFISGDKRQGLDGEPFALKSDLGWLIVGEKESHYGNPNYSYHTSLTNNATQEQQPRVTLTDTDLDKTLRSFWEIETNSDPLPLSTEEQACEEHFMTTYAQEDDGTFIVTLPFKTAVPDLGSSCESAIQRLRQLERRLDRDSQIKEEYVTFMREYLQMGHMEEIPADEILATNTYYIPHHYITKESATTKFRVVFDASATTSNGKSLNQYLMVGATLQDPLYQLLLRFRTHPVAITADIAKMFRQIKAVKSHHNYQRIVWREDSSTPIRHYRLLTVTYGTACAPFLATRVLQQLARIHADTHPLASKVMLRDFYMDDLMSGASSVPAALKLQAELVALMKLGGFELRKWSSNHPALLSSIPEELRETKSLLPVEFGHTVKTLGIYWNPSSDTYFFKIDSISTLNHNKPLTKRLILSDIAKLFDPVGWLAPVVIVVKILMQSLWTLELGWDDPVPTEVQQMWIDYKADLTHLEALRIPRCIVPAVTPSTKLAFIGFGDASSKAYAAMVYLVAYQDSGPPQVSLITSKTRVAPTQTVSIPRLELCASEVLAKLMITVKHALNLELDHISAWSDSTDTLAWIDSVPSTLKTFVANRVSKIQQRIPASQWGHIAGVDNPADCASRGLDAAAFINFSLWWNGPSILQRCIPSPSIPKTQSTAAKLEVKKDKLISLRTQVSQTSSFIKNYSSLVRLKRITAWIFRFHFNCLIQVKSRKSFNNSIALESNPAEVTRVGNPSGLCGLVTGSRTTLMSGPLVPKELDQAMVYLIKLVQSHSFSFEIKGLQDSNNPQVPHKSSILSLNPFLDQEGVLRVGGRLHKAPIGFERKHPAVLPHKSHLTQLLIKLEHLKLLHAGPQLVLSTIQTKYWVIRGRDAVRSTIRNCMTCTKLRATTMQQLMGNLPEFRVTPSRPFSNVGVDYAGPFQLKPMVPRCKTTLKAYLCIFVCCVTRAVHLELVSNLSTEAFLAALRRFTSRRGKSSHMYSDCGTNFKGANRELQSLVSSQQHNAEIVNQLSGDGIVWKFNPPGAPHFVGLWEAGVKSVKFHLTRVIGITRLNYEEMTTTFNQIEAVLNSRPLTPESNSPSDLSALTPGHFLIGAPPCSSSRPRCFSPQPRQTQSLAVSPTAVSIILEEMV